jgi:hypothetical protein
MCSINLVSDFKMRTSVHGDHLILKLAKCSKAECRLDTPVAHRAC